MGQCVKAKEAGRTDLNVQSTFSMHIMSLLGGSGGMPPRKFLKLDVMRLNVEAILS